MGTTAEYAPSILLAVSAIPLGRVSTYGQIASLVGCGGPRVVARVLATQGGDVCWWRVVRANGTIAPQLIAEASQHLAAEGVKVQGGRVVGFGLVREVV